MAIEVKVKLEELRSLAFGSIGAAYMGVGTALDHPARMLLIQNFTDEDVMFSFDGITDHFPLKSEAAIVLDVSANKTIDSGFFFEKGTRLYVKDIIHASSGSVYLTAFYGSED